MPWPHVVYSEEVMREGFGIEDVRIPLEARLALIEALSETGLGRITLGAFVSPRFVPQMACFEELLRRLRPRNGVKYLAFIHNEKARQQAEQYAPPLTVEAKSFALFIDVCDIHQRRNVNRSIEQAMAGWPDAVSQARARGVTEGGIGIASAWGSNFSGKFTQRYCVSFLERQAALLESAGIAVNEIALHDSQSWCLPHEMEKYLAEARHRWPKVRRFHFHMHNARGMALPSIYAALRSLGPEHTVLLDGTLGGIGGGQYGGNGTASGMAPTEDLMHMLEGMGIETGVDLDKIIDCVWMLEKIIGRAAFGAVSRAGPRPSHAHRYDPNLPAIETPAAARHFKLGPAAYATEGYSPWRAPIAGPFWQGAEAPPIP
jgi:hydroxymethylglutaryl-CoA lyase